MSRYHLYHRVSKVVQSETGLGIERQQQSSEIWIENHNIHRVSQGLPSYTRGRVYEDRGRSGYTAANLKKGELGQLMSDIDRCFIEKGDIIVIELIDRFSRAKPDFVRMQLEKILAAGVKIAITKWNIVFEKDMKGIEGVSARVLLEIGIYLANQESTQKSIRSIASNKIMKEKGLKSIAKTPIWLNRSYDYREHEIIPQNAEVIKEIYKMRMDNRWGAAKIITKLREMESEGKLNGFVAVKGKRNLTLARYVYNEEGVLVQSSLNSPLVASTINAVLRNKAVIGELKGEKEYYPPIIEEGVFYAVQKTFESNKGGGGTADFINVFRNIARCGWLDENGNKCGYRLSFSQRKVINPEKGMYLKCNSKKHRKNCNAKNVDYFKTQNTVYKILKSIKYETNSSIDISSLEAKRDEVIKQLGAVRKYMAEYPTDVMWKKDYETLALEEREITDTIESNRTRVNGRLEDLDLDFSKTNDRSKFNQILKDYKVEITFCEMNVIVNIGVWGGFEIRFPYDYEVGKVSEMVEKVMRSNLKGIILSNSELPKFIMATMLPSRK